MTLNLPVGLLALLKKRKHFLITLWKLIRTDGFTLRYTDYTSDILFEGETFTPSDGLSASAKRKEANLETQNLEIIGIISDDSIKHDDLRGGLYRNAVVEEQVIDFRHPYLGALITNQYTITEVRYNVERWEAKVEGLKRKLRPKVGKLYARDCNNDLGDAVCRVDVQALSENGTVLVLTGAGLTERAIFDTTGLTEVDDFFTFGRLAWITGENAGIKSQVKKHIVGVATSIELFEPTPFAIAVNDQFNVEPGCDKLKDTCINKFDNIVNYEGFPFIPSPDRIIVTPELK